MKKIIGIVIISLSLIIVLINTKEEEKENNPFEVLGDLAYTLDGEKTTESYETLMANNEVNKITCEKGTIAKWNNTNKTLKLNNIQNPDYCTIDFKSKPKTLYNQILIDHPTILTRSSFDEVPSETEITKTIYKEETNIETGGNNNKVVYYFYGNTTDNWVKFAGAYWRIIRTNEDGSVRLLYAGTSPDTKEGYITSTRKDMINGTTEENQTTTWYAPNSSTYNNTMYVGYMYGSTGSLANNRENTNDSGIKYFIDEWYKNNINSSYGSYISETAIYCNDRSGGAYSSNESMAYAVFVRVAHALRNGRKPTYRCGYNSTGEYVTYSSDWIWNNSTVGMYEDASDSDKFSKSTTNGGNGKLTYPVALMTADEVAFAGGLFGYNSPNTYYYLNSANGSVTGDKYWWTMSPFYFNGDCPLVIGVAGRDYPGYMSDYIDLVNARHVRPVLSLKSCVTVKEGTKGTSDNPYEVEIDNTCISKEN